MEEKTLRTALQLAQKDPVFAVQLVQDPEKFAKEFNLSSEQVSSLGKGRELIQSAVKAGIIGVDVASLRHVITAAAGPYG